MLTPERCKHARLPPKGGSDSRKLKQEKVVIQRMDELVFVRLRERNENLYAHPLFYNDPE